MKKLGIFNIRNGPEIDSIAAASPWLSLEDIYKTLATKLVDAIVMKLPLSQRLAYHVGKAKPLDTRGAGRYYADPHLESGSFLNYINVGGESSERDPLEGRCRLFYPRRRKVSLITWGNIIDHYRSIYKIYWLDWPSISWNIEQKSGSIPLQ